MSQKMSKEGRTGAHCIHNKGEVVEVVVEGVVFLLYLCENTIQKPKTLNKQLYFLPCF